MTILNPTSWICLTLLAAHASSAPPRNAVTENASSELNIDPNNIANLEKLQDIHTDNKQMGLDASPGPNKGPDLAADGQTLATETGVEKTVSRQSDAIQNGNAADVNSAETAPVLSETVQGVVEKEPTPTQLEAVKTSAADVVHEGTDTAPIGDPKSSKESAFICIEIASPDAFKAGLMHQAEKIVSKSGFDKLGKIGSKVDTIFKKMFQKFMHSKTVPGSMDKTATSVSLDTSVENTHSIEKGNAAMDPLTEKTAMKEVSSQNEGVDVLSDPFHDIHPPIKQNIKVFTGDEARQRSKKIFANLQNVGDKIGQVFNEFFPGLVNVKISTGPKSNVKDGITSAINEKSHLKPDFVKNNFLRKDNLNNVYIPTDNKNGDVSKSVKSKPIKTVDKLEKGIDSIIGGIKPFVNPFLKRFNRKTDNKSQRKSDTFFDSNFHKEMESLGRKIRHMMENIFSESFMKDRFFFGPSKLDTKGLPPKSDKPLKDPIKSSGDLIPKEPAKKQENVFKPGIDLNTDPLADPYFNGEHLSQPTFDPYVGINDFQKRFQGIYRDLVRTMIGPFMQSVSKSLTDSFGQAGKDTGMSQRSGDKFRDPPSSTVV